MGDTSVIARRLSDGHVQYGWGGNGGCLRNTGIRLLSWYLDAKDVEYLFSLGQTSGNGKPGSENGGCKWYERHGLTGEPFWLGNSEREIFSKLMFVNYGYFFDTDDKWYYILVGPFRIKMPLMLVAENSDDECYEFEFCQKVENDILKYIFTDYLRENLAFQQFLKIKSYDAEKILEAIQDERFNCQYSQYKLFDLYRDIFDYFDDWILVTCDENYKNIEKIIVKKQEEKHPETCCWKTV